MKTYSQQWTVSKRVTAGFIAVGVIGVLLIAVFENGMTNLVRYHEATSVTEQRALTLAQGAATAAELYQIVADAQINQNFAETHKDWEAMKKIADERLATIDGLINTDEERTALADARDHYKGMVTAFEVQMLPLLEKEHRLSEATRQLDDEVDEQAAGMAERLKALSDDLIKQAAVATEEFTSTARTTQRLVLVVVGIGLVLGFGVAFLVVSGLTRRLSGVLVSLDEGAQTILSTSGQVSGSAASLSQGATEQAASLEETSASMEEMASMTRKNAENTQEAAQLVAEVHRRVNESHAALNDMVASMADIKESSQKVSKIIKTIDEIAFQTNILALNAAVEAARAGEAGMGFAVVADEVRNLAQRSAQAAKDTAGLIEESITKSQAGSTKVEQVAAAITGITDSVTRVKGLVDEVSEASRQQAQGIDQVSQAIAQMEKVTQTTAATAEESAAASEELNAQAKSAIGAVHELEALVGGNGSVTPVAAAKSRSTVIARPVPATSSIASRKVVPMSPRSKPTPPSAEEFLPLEDTGTFGSF